MKQEDSEVTASSVFSTYWHVILAYILAYGSTGICISVIGPCLLQLGRQVCIFGSIFILSN